MTQMNVTLGAAGQKYAYAGNTEQSKVYSEPLVNPITKQPVKDADGNQVYVRKGDLKEITRQMEIGSKLEGVTKAGLWDRFWSSLYDKF